jgi:hypothetical protein
MYIWQIDDLSATNIFNYYDYCKGGGNWEPRRETAHLTNVPQSYSAAPQKTVVQLEGTTELTMHVLGDTLCVHNED